MAQWEKIPGGFKVDGLELRRGKYGCGGLAFVGQATAPSTQNNYEWGYRVRKGDMVVEVKMTCLWEPSWA